MSCYIKKSLYLCIKKRSFLKILINYINYIIQKFLNRTKKKSIFLFNVTYPSKFNRLNHGVLCFQNVLRFHGKLVKRAHIYSHTKYSVFLEPIFQETWGLLTALCVDHLCKVSLRSEGEKSKKRGDKIFTIS